MNTPKDYPIGGDKTDDIECPHCGDTDTVYEEHGTTESDDSELNIVCNNCDTDDIDEEDEE